MVRKGENIYKRKDKRWEGRYIKKRFSDNNVQYGYIYGYSYTEVKKKLDLMKALHQKNYMVNKTVYSGTLDQWADHWMLIIQKRIKQSTYVSYLIKYRRHISPSIGQVALNELTKADIQYCLKQLETKLSANSIRVVGQVLRTFLEDAVTTGVLEMNPYRNIQLPKQNRPNVRALTLTEQKELMNTASLHEKGLIILFALETGLRIGELAGLKWTDIDIIEQTFHVKRTLQRIPVMNNSGRSKTKLIETTPKSNSSQRIIPLGTAMFKRLMAQKENTDGVYVFGGSSPIEPRLISYWFKKICLATSLSNINFHSLRHTFATRCIENNVPIVTISSLLGHDSTKMTLDTYLSSSISEKRKAIKLIGQEVDY